MKKLCSFLLIVIVSSAAICLGQEKDNAQPLGVTLAAYSKIKLGMKYPQAVKIIGKEGTELASGKGATGLFTHVKVVEYQWRADDGRGNMILMFSNGKLKNKAQSGLR